MSNTYVGETFESLLDCKGIPPVHPKGDRSWVFIGRTDVEAENSNTLATWCKELTHLKSPWCWERLKAGGKGDDRGWDGWMASPTQWTWIWVNSRNWWWTGRPGMLWQRIWHDWVTELNWIYMFASLFLREMKGLFAHNTPKASFMPIDHPSSSPVVASTLPVLSPIDLSLLSLFSPSAPWKPCSVHVIYTQGKYSSLQKKNASLDKTGSCGIL